MSAKIRKKALYTVYLFCCLRNDCYFCIEMNENRYTRLLTEHGVKPTSNRILIIKALATAGRPMSLSELERNILTIDKSSVFRALTIFREHHLLHVIEDSGDGVRYELCNGHDDEDGDSDVHAHFYCERCHRTFCIDNVPVPPVPLPAGYRQTSVNYIMKGLCPECGG